MKNIDTTGITGLNDPLDSVVAAATQATAPKAAPSPESAPAICAIGSLPWRFSCFVTGTDTEIGKTMISAAILHQLVVKGVRACGMKPIAAGAALRDGVLHNDDADLLRAAGNVHLPVALTTPFMLRTAAAPHIAAAIDGVTIAPVPIIAAYAEIAAASDAVVVEGVGGFRVPLTDDFDTADLAAQLNLPVVLVVGMRLGCISHALLTVEAIIARNLVLAGWVANHIDPHMQFADDNVAALAARIPAPLLGRVPFMDAPDHVGAAACLDLAALPGWPRASD